MLNICYHFQLTSPIYKNLVTIGKYDGINPSICYATNGGKVIIYSPHSKLFDEFNPEDAAANNSKFDIITLNLNKEISTLTFCLGDLRNTKEYLFIGSPASLMCFDVMANKTIFDKDVNDGVYCTAAGVFSKFNQPLCFVGGNCSLQGFDINGEERFWTVTGGNTVCMTLNDIDDDGFLELIVGTDDYSIRFYKDEKDLCEINENTKIVLLQPLGNSRFVYCLENGTIGVYNRTDRLWKKKEKGVLNSCVYMDVNNDGQNELICGWSTGKLQIRKETNGDVIQEIELNNEISKLVIADLNNSGKKQIACFLENGEVIGYEYREEEKQIDKPIMAKDAKIPPEELVKFEKLQKEKQKLIDEIESLTIKLTNRGKSNVSKDENCLPSNTTVKIDLQSNSENKCADLIIEASERSTIIKCVVVVSEQLYKGETFVQYPSSETNKIVIQIKNDKDMNINLHIKVLVGTSFYGKDFQVFEFNKIIPKYCFYILLRDDILTQYKIYLKQGVSFKINERLDRLLLWLESNFNIPFKELATFKNNNNTYDIRFLSLRTDKVLQIFMQNNTIQIMTDEIELAGNILQDLSSYFQLNESETTVTYPDIVEELNVLIQKIEKLDNVRNQFSINMAEIITYIKDVFVRAEDNRILDNIQAFKEYFMKINFKNLELLDEFEKRTQVYEELLIDLKKVNGYIQNFANLKIGTQKTKVISLCRESIRNKNYKLLIKVISTGNE